MGRLVVLLLISVQTLLAFKYNEVLLDAQCRVYPKILMFKENGRASNDKEIKFTIVYSEDDKDIAKKAVEKIEHYFDHKIGNVEFSVNMVSYNDLDSKIKSDAFYLLRADSEMIRKAIELAQKKEIAVFAYDFHNLQDGALLALNIENTMIIYLNKKALNKTNFTFKHEFYSIVRFVDAG